MKHVRIALPEALADEAARKGLLADEAVAKLFEDALRREAGRDLIALMERVHAVDLPPLTDAEINEEVRAARAERRREQTEFSS